MKSQGKRINRQINDRRVLFALKRLMKTQKAAARRVGCSDDMFRYYLTDAQKIPVEIIAQAKVILHQHREKAPELEDKNLFIEDELLTVLPLTMQAKLAKEELTKAKIPANEITEDHQKKNQSRENFPKKERMDEKIAKKYSFKNRKTLHNAIFVQEKGCDELHEAMNEGKRIKIYLAAKIATLPKARQRELLTWEVAKIRAYFKAETLQAKQKKNSQTIITSV